MNNWTDGYIADIEYTYGYYGELNPLRVAMPFLNVALMPPTIATACELGFGQGVTVNIHAAASDVRWYGTDFNPGQAAFAQSLAESARSGAQLFDQSFGEFCNRADLPDFDFIALHGIYSWISDENQRSILDFVRRKLKVGGVLYISYNTLPGFAATGPLQHLLSEHGRVMAPPGSPLLGKVDAALEFVEKLMALNPVYGIVNPSFIERLRQVKNQNRQYVAHEYFNHHWRPLRFADLAESLGEAKLTFACSAHYLDHVDALNLTTDQHRFLAELTDPVFRQTVRDFIVNAQFRRDFWVKGARRLPLVDQVEALKQLKIMLTGVRSEVALNVTGALGKRDMTPTVYDPILEILADHAPKTIGEIEQSLSGAGLRLATIYEAIMVLAGKGDLVVVQDEAAQARAKAHTDRLNLRILDRARTSSDLLHMASPVNGGGVAAGRFHQLFLLASRQGRQSADEMAQFAWDTISPQGQRVLREGKTIESQEDNLAELAIQARDFIDHRLSIFQKLQIA